MHERGKKGGGGEEGCSEWHCLDDDLQLTWKYYSTQMNYSTTAASSQIIQIKYFCCGEKKCQWKYVHTWWVNETTDPLSHICKHKHKYFHTHTHTLTYHHHTTTFGICFHKLNVTRKSLFLTEMTSVPWLFGREYTGIDKLKEHFLSYLTRKCNKHNRYNAHLTHTIRRKK